MRISDWSSDVCSSDLDFLERVIGVHADPEAHPEHAFLARGEAGEHPRHGFLEIGLDRGVDRAHRVHVLDEIAQMRNLLVADRRLERSEEHTSELQSLMRISTAVLCLQKTQPTS